MRVLGCTFEAGTDLVNTNWSAGTLDLVGSGAGPVGFNAVINRIPIDTKGKQFIKLKVGFTE